MLIPYTVPGVSRIHGSLSSPCGSVNRWVKKNSGSAPATAPLHWRPFLPHILIFPLVTGAS